MLSPSIYRVKNVGAWNIALSPRPRGGEDLDEEIFSLRAAGVDLVVSLLEAAEIRELDLLGQKASCERNNIAFCHFPIPDRGIPEHTGNFNSLVALLAREVEAGKSLVIHCRAGIGRTGLVACCLLQSLGMKSEQSWLLLGEARGVSVPDTAEQRKYAESFLS